MSRLFPIYPEQYIPRLRRAPLEERLEITFEFIDSIVNLFLNESLKEDNKQCSLNLINNVRQGQREFKKIVRYKTIVHIEGDFEYELSMLVYPDYLCSRFLKTAQNVNQYYSMAQHLQKIFTFLGMRFNPIEKYEDFTC